MPTDRLPLARPPRGALTISQLMELQYGPNPSGSYFASKEELFAGWQRARERLLEQSRPGYRPMGWWAFDTDVRYPGYYLERSTLWRMPGVISAEERVTLEHEWKAAFAEARGMTARERREHFEHHDIP